MKFSSFFVFVMLALLVGCNSDCYLYSLDYNGNGNFDRVIDRKVCVMPYSYTTILYGEKCDIISKNSYSVKHCFINNKSGKYEIIKGNLEVTAKITRSVIEMPFTGGRAMVVWDTCKTISLPIDERIKLNSVNEKIKINSVK